MSELWFVVYCKSREELRAQQNLQNQEIRSFFPKIRKEKIVRGKKVTAEEALFPGYLFILIDQQDINFTRIRSTRGINDFVRFGTQITTVSQEIIQKMEVLCHSFNDLTAGCVSLFKPGDRVEILSGSFRGLTALFSEQDGLQRSILLLKFLNQENKISFNNEEIKKWGS